MRRLAFTTALVLACTMAVIAQESVPLTEPTNRSVPPKLKTAGIYSFCEKDQSLAFVPENDRTLVHQSFGLSQTSGPPLHFEDAVSHLSLSPDAQVLAAIVNRSIVLVPDRMVAHMNKVELPDSFEVSEKSVIHWSANSKVLFAVNGGSPASAVRISIDQGKQLHPIAFQSGRYFVASREGDLLVAFSNGGAEIWRQGVDTNKIVSGKSKMIVGSPDGRFVAFMANDALQIWTLDPLGKGGNVAAYGAGFIKFSADGNRLIVFEVDDKVKCYKVSEKGELTLLQEYKATNGRGWLSADGALGACFSYSDTSRLMRVFSCIRKADSEIPIVTKSMGLGAYDPDIFPLEFQLSQDARRGLVVWPAGRIEMFNIESGLPDWGCRVPDLAKVWLIANGDRIETMDRAGNLQLHHTNIGRAERKTVDVEKAPVNDNHFRDTKFRFQVLPNGTHCVVWCGPRHRDFKVVEMSTGKVVGGAVASDKEQNDIRGWHASDDGSIICLVGERVKTLRTGFQANASSSSENTGRFHLAVKAAGLREPVHGIYDTKAGQMLRTLQWEYVDDSSFTLGAHISPDGQLCALVGRRADGEGKGVEVRSTITGEQIFAVPLHDMHFSWMDFTRDQKGMWVVTREALMRLDFERKTLEPVFSDAETYTEPLKANPKTPTPLQDSEWQTTQFQCFSESDSGWIATGHRRGFVNIWSTKDRKRYAFLRCGTEVIRALAFSPDGRYLLSWCADRNKLQLTDISSILPLSPPNPKVGNEGDLDLDF